MTTVSIWLTSFTTTISNPSLRMHAFETIVLPFIESLGGCDDWKVVLAEALTYNNKELFQVFKDFGMVFMTPVEDPHAFLVDLWNTVFANEPI